jgi:hypothetical protein
MMRATFRAFLGAVLLILPLFFSPSTLSADLGSTNVKRLGKTVVQWKDDTVQIVVSWRHAQQHLDARWILLDFSFFATSGKPVTINREDIELILPDGRSLNLPSQSRVAKGIPDIRRMLQEADVNRDPVSGYFVGPGRQQQLRLFTIPGEGVVFDEVSGDHQILTQGDLFFESRTGHWVKGIYTLQIKNRDLNVKLPIPLGIEGELERVK